MNKLNWHLGIIWSCVVGGLAATIGLLRLDYPNIIQNLQVALYYFVFSLGAWMINHWLLHKAFRKSTYLAFAGFIVGVVIIGPLYSFIFEWVNQSLLERRMLVIGAAINQEMLLFRDTMCFVMNAFIVLFVQKMKENQERAIEVEQLKQAQLQANLSSLKEQLSPHFLFNTFSTLRSLTKETMAKKYVDELSSVYRYLLRYHKNDLATLGQEIDFTNSYYYILKTRFEEGIQLKVTICDSLLRNKIPPLTLQLLVENAIKHNVITMNKPLFIHIYADEEYIRVQNNYQPKPAIQSHEGIGLTNIAERYRILFNKDIAIESDDSRFIVKLPMI